MGDVVPMPGLCPECPRCNHRHLFALPCWGGRRVPKIRAMVFAEYGTTCWLCGLPGADTVDHVHARALGGTDTLSNLRPAHGYCNTGRGAKPARKPAPASSTAEESSSRW
jgi:5-methylcytosine-specific restriction endonuclease McrA